MDVNKYVGIPFKHHGRDIEGVDCYGLVRLVLSNEFDKHLPDFWQYETADDIPSVGSLFDTQVPILTKKVEAPSPGNVVLYRFRGYTSHIGVYVGGGLLLHVMRNINSVCVPIDKGILRGRLEGFYEIN